MKSEFMEVLERVLKAAHNYTEAKMEYDNAKVAYSLYLMAHPPTEEERAKADEAYKKRQRPSFDTLMFGPAAK